MRDESINLKQRGAGAKLENEFGMEIVSYEMFDLFLMNLVATSVSKSYLFLACNMRFGAISATQKPPNQTSLQMCPTFNERTV